MARSNRPRDLGQELTDLHALVRGLMTGALTRPAMRVEQGNFPVSGGGSIIVTDGGRVRALTSDGGEAQLSAGALRLRPTDDAAFGYISTDAGTAATMLRIHPPYRAGSGLANSVALEGARPGFGGAVWVYSGGNLSLTAVDTASITGNIVSISTPQLELYNLPQIATPTYALGYHYNSSNDTFSVRLVTSSRKYKDDERPVEIDADRFLQIQPKTWRDKAEVKEDPKTTNRHFGVIAEDLVELGLGDLLVSFVNGEPESVHYPQIAVGLIPIVREDRATIAKQAARIVALEDQNKKILARLDALEAAPTEETS